MKLPAFLTSWKPFSAITACLLAACLAAPAVSAQDGIADDYEWDPTYGYHEEEWYDPSDWFDADTGVEYEDYEDNYYGNYYDDDYTGVGEYEEEWYEDNDWYGDNFYTSDWYDNEPEFDDWYVDEY